MDPRPILVIGGTRGTGRLIVQLLRQRGDTVRVLARNPGRAVTSLGSAVEIVEGDLTVPNTLAPAIRGARHVIFTAGCRSGYPVLERDIKAVEFDGVVHTLAAARHVAFGGRFLYMTSSGVKTRNLAAGCLNLWKGNTLMWRRRVEDEIRASGVDYTIIRAGVLLNRPEGQHPIQITQQPLPLAWRYRIARADVARTFVAALDHSRTPRTTFEVVWGQTPAPQPLQLLLNNLRSDDAD
jgi:uncharacterized protein YbjT (DUF2867 family)